MSQFSILRFSDEKLTPILKSFLESVANFRAYSFSFICLKASSGVESYFNSILSLLFLSYRLAEGR